MSWYDVISKGKPIIDQLVNNPPKCPMCNHSMMVVQVREANKQVGTRVVLWEADLICPHCSYDRTVRIGYDVRRDLKIGRLISSLPEDLKTDPHLYHEELCIWVRNYKICESHNLFTIREVDDEDNERLVLITPDIEAVKALIEQAVPGLVIE